MIDPACKATARVVFRESAVVCGLSVAKEVFKLVDQKIRFSSKFKDGNKIKSNTVVLTATGKARSLLKAERTVLNFISHLSAIASKTAEYTKQVKGTKAKIFDTRKTVPGLRALQKYAVKCGGGENHRMNLNEMAMVKDNHLYISKRNMSIKEAVEKIRKKSKKKIEVEVDTINQFKEALISKADIILLDNMSLMQMKKCVELSYQTGAKRPLLEASGGIRLNRVKAIANTGVDRISVGNLTHSINATDVSMEFI